MNTQKYVITKQATLRDFERTFGITIVEHTDPANAMKKSKQPKAAAVKKPAAKRTVKPKARASGK